MPNISKRWITSAPESYDYWYVKTVDTVTDRYGKSVRVVEHDDDHRFENFQRPRYASGLHYCWPVGGPDADYLLGDDCAFG